MTNELNQDTLAKCTDSIISTGGFASTGDEGVDALARLATGLRGLPNPEFRSRLKAELVPRPRGLQPPSLSSLPGASWVRAQHAFLGAGASFGVVAGACCISGAAANVLGIASAAAVQEFIESTLPYFVALSIVGLFGWLLWFLREQGITLTAIALTIRRHGFAMAGSYALMFGASMTLTVAMGLY